MGRLVWFSTLVLAIALGTFAFGWAAPAVIGAAWAAVRRDDAFVPLLASLSGMLGWGALLGVQALAGPVARVAEVVGAAMQVGTGPLLALTLAFPALLAGSAAGLVRGIASK
jgi:hypothetical protein